ncbi:reverse transcriptase domain-containing protein [Tanacetum coccineum]
MYEYMASHTERVERFEEAMIKRKEKLEERMDKMLELVKKLVSSSTPKKDKGEKHEQIIDKNVVELHNDVNKPLRLATNPLEKQLRNSFNDSLLAMETGKMECEDYHSLPRISIRNAIMLTDEKLVETDVRLALASNSHIYPLGVVEDVLVEVTSFVYLVDFMILDIKEDVNKPLILGTPFLTTARAEIKFDKGTISLRFGKSTVQFHISPNPFPTLEERDENKINILSVVNERVLKWEEKIKFHHMKELEFEAWKSKYSKSKALAPKDESSSGTSKNQGGVT